MSQPFSPPFSVTDPDTWPAILTADEVAAIFRRKVGGLKRAVQRGEFQPEPYQRHPYRWRKSEVQRFVESGRVSSLRRT
jgi:hypothetical protein